MASSFAWTGIHDDATIASALEVAHACAPNDTRISDSSVASV
jgi:hypothetical protein